MESLDLCKKIVSVLDEKKGSDIIVLDISEISVLSDYFVLVSADNVRQLDALKDALEEAVHLDNRKAEGREPAPAGFF